MNQYNEFYDIISKMTYHKETVLKELIQKGIYPENKMIESRIADIDLHLSVFKHNNVVAGNNFDVKEFNEALKLIHKDITILYSILYKLQVEEYQKQRSFINSYLTELTNIANSYKKRADFENATTTLGKTILFQNDNFKINNNNSTTEIILNDVEIEEASSVICIANINNVNEENLLITLEDKDGTINTISPYNYSGDVLKLSGDKKVNTYNITIPEDQIINGPILLNTASEVNINNRYTILGGKNKIFINYKDSNDYEIQDSPTSLGSYIYNNKTYINFYIVNGNSISFKFNKKPIATNFQTNEQILTNLDPIHHFFIECDDDFTFEIEIDKGDIYAIKEDGIINNNKLYYTSTNLIRDFNIIEESAGALKKYQPKLKILNNNDDSYDIESIIIKQLQ